MLNVVTIYWENNGEVAADGLQSSIVCDEAINVAKRIAIEANQRVVVEDVPARNCYMVMKNGKITKAPKEWIPVWKMNN